MAERRGDRTAPDLERSDVEAMLEVRRELGPEYEPALVDSFAERMHNAIEERVDARLAQRERAGETEKRLHNQQLTLGIVSLGTGIPITAVAGGVGDGLPGVLVAWAGIAAVNFAYALRRRER
jgi:hypothetical protein